MDNIFCKTIDVLGTRGWTGKHGNLEDSDGSVCVIGAMAYAVGESSARYPEEYDNPQNQVEVERAASILAATIMENYPEEGELEDHLELVYTFNDDLETKQIGVEPLIRMLEKAAAKLDEQT